MAKKLLMGLGLIAGILVLVAAIVMGSQWLGSPVAAQTGTSGQTSPAQAEATLPRTVTVVGEGVVTIKPDIARATIGVETMGTSAKVASAEAAEVMETLFEVLKEQGVAEKDIQTSGYSIWTDRGIEMRTAEGPTYRVNNTVSVTIRDLDKVGTVMDAVIEAGANAIHGVQFSIAEPEDLMSEAREKAAANALEKAQELAALHNVQVGEVISISEVIESGYAPMGMALERAAAFGGGAGPIAPGELEVSVRLQVVYGIH